MRDAALKNANTDLSPGVQPERRRSREKSGRMRSEPAREAVAAGVQAANEPAREAFAAGVQAADKPAPRPFLKWAGGKRQLLPQLERSLPGDFNRYFEPMLGGGALFFHLAPEAACLSDVNPELINAYQVVQQRVEQLIALLKRHATQHSEQYFYDLRQVDREPRYRRWGAVQRAARMLYLNRTCFNGLYRVNASGHFNTPFGRYTNPTIVDPENLHRCSKALQDVQLVSRSFEQLLADVRPNDLVYFDPPYVPLSASANFTSYSKQGFDADMQTALSEVCRELDRRGVYFMLSNSSADFVKELYRDFSVRLVPAARAINSKADCRGKIDEVLVTNY